MSYDPKVSFKKAAMAAMYAGIGVLAADPNLLPFFVEKVPDPTIRMVLGMAVPYFYAWALNWWKNRNR